MNLPRMIVADDHALVAEALCKLAAPCAEVIATVGDGRALLEVAMTLKPDLVVVDLAMPLLNGLDAGKELKKRLPNVKLIFLTMNEDPDLAVEAIKSGASAYLLKKSAGSELLDAIRAATAGKAYITPKIKRGMQESFIRDPQGTKRGKPITPRQREVVQLLAEGKPMKVVADILKVAPRTVAFHKYRVMQDLGLKTSAELVQFALKNKIIIQ
ncbi:MAG: response regulator transcription factor [Candidatus Acidiferrum sp.]